MSPRKRIQILLGALMGIPLLLLLWESYRTGRTTFVARLKLESLQIAKLEEEGIALTSVPSRFTSSGGTAGRARSRSRTSTRSGTGTGSPWRPVGGSGPSPTSTSEGAERWNSWIVETPVDSLSEAQGGGDWALIVSWPLDLRLAPLGGFARRMLVLYLFLGGAALLILDRSFDGVISRPLHRLGNQARRYVQGDFERQPPGDGYAPELRELSQALESLGEAPEKRDRSPSDAEEAT